MKRINFLATILFMSSAVHSNEEHLTSVPTHLACFELLPDEILLKLFGILPVKDCITMLDVDQRSRGISSDILTQKFKDKTLDINRLLRFASTYNKISLVKLIISLKNKKIIDNIDVNTRDRNRNTPLLLASACGNSTVVEYLISSGANTNVKDYFGVTPLIIASGSGNKRVVELLILHHADVDTKDLAGFEALDYACLIDHKNIIQILKREKLNRAKTYLKKICCYVNFSLKDL